MNDIRMYNYYDDEPLVTRQTQAKNYFDKKWGVWIQKIIYGIIIIISLVFSEDKSIDFWI